MARPVSSVGRDVIGFVLTSKDKSPRSTSAADTVWYDGRGGGRARFKAGVVLPFAGAAQTRGPFHLTMIPTTPLKPPKRVPGTP